MNQQEQSTKRAAIFQDTINGTNDPTPWPVTMWASSGDTIWTAGTARTAGEDSVGMIYGPGETIVHRNTIAGDTTRATESFAIRPADGQSPMDAMLAGIEQWNHRHPDRWDTVTTPGEYRMMDPTTGRPLPMGWSASLAVAASAAGRLDPNLLQASLMQNAVEHEPRPCVFFLEDNGYDLMVFSWHRNQQGLFDAMSFKHLQYDDLSMQVTCISHSEDMRESNPVRSCLKNVENMRFLNVYCVFCPHFAHVSPDHWQSEALARPPLKPPDSYPHQSPAPAIHPSHRRRHPNHRRTDPHTRPRSWSRSYAPAAFAPP